MNTINILYINDSLNRGGAENQLLLYFSYLPSNYIVHFAYFDRESILLDQVPENVKLVHIGKTSFFDVVAFLKLRRYISQNKINVVHCHSLVDSLYAMKIGWLSNVGVAITIHGFWLKKHLLIFKIFYRLFGASRVICVSEALKDYVVKAGIDNVDVVHNGLDFGQFIQKSHTNMLVPKFGMVTRFSESKDHITICNAVRILKENRDIGEFKVCFYGDDENKYGKEVKQYIKDHNLSEQIICYGEVADVADRLNSLNFYLASSKKETFGIAMLEAMYSGLPVIASNIPVYVDILDNGLYGNIFKIGDADTLARLMIEYIQDVEMVEKYRINGFERSKEYGIDKTIDSLNSIYENIICR